MPKISRIEIDVLRFPVNIGLIWGKEKWTSHLLVKLYANDTIGIGEGTPYFTDIYNSYVLCKKVAQRITKMDIYKAKEELPNIQHELSSKTLFDYAPFLALETAIIDALGKIEKVPFNKIFGRPFRNKIPVSGTVFLDSPKNMAKVAKKWVSKGITHLKVKVTGKNNVDSLNLEHIRDAVGPDVLIRIDANQAYRTIRRAVESLRKLEKYDIAIVEQPIKWNDLDGLRKLKKIVKAEIMVDESLRKFSDIELIAQKEAADIINFHPSKLGCLTITKAGIKKAEELGLKYMIGASVMTGIGVAAHLHLAASLRELPYPNEEIGLYEICGLDIAVPPNTVEKGHMKVPGNCGLGLKIDEDKVKRYLLKVDVKSPRVILTRTVYWAYLKSPEIIRELIKKPLRVRRYLQ